MNRVLGTSIERTTHGWRSLTLRAYVVRTAELPFDGRVSPVALVVPGGSPEISFITIPLEGEYVSLRGAGGIVVRPGDALVERRFTWEERWESGMRALVIEWSAQHGTPRVGRLRLAPADLAHARALADEICAPREADPFPPLARFLERLRAIGVGFVPTEELSLPQVPDDVVRIERAMSELLVHLERGPAGVDLARSTGLSERHLRRLFEQYQAWLGSFRGRVRHARLPSAANWLATSKVPTEQVARSLGYGSARALVRALDDADDAETRR